ncbi:hypothetical protein V8E51_005125, partial [Hyaloscypha variabilis]
MGGYGWTVLRERILYYAVGAGAGAVGMAVWAFGVVLPKRLTRRALGGATPLAHGVRGEGEWFHIGVLRILRLYS